MRVYLIKLIRCGCYLCQKQRCALSARDSQISPLSGEVHQMLVGGAIAGDGAGFYLCY